MVTTVDLCSNLHWEVERSCPTGQTSATKTSTMIKQNSLLKRKASPFAGFKFYKVIFKYLILNHPRVIQSRAIWKKMKRTHPILVIVCKALVARTLPILSSPLHAGEENTSRNLNPFLGASMPEWIQTFVIVWLTLKVPRTYLLDPSPQV